MCLYKNASSTLRGDPCETKIGQEINANIIACYQNRPDTDVYEGAWKKPDRCENPKCNSIADTRFNGEINLCFKCLDLLREWKTNYELGTIFKRKDKTIKLLKLIDEQINQPQIEMVRCSNIYCGTVENMTRHHLIPKAFRNRQTVPKIPLCEECHKKVHRLATNQELAEKFNTKQSVVELLAKDITFRKERFMNVYENNLMAVA